MREGNANLLFDSVSANTGDIAIGLANKQLFEALGLRARIVSPFDAEVPSPLVIGGGELIRTKGDKFYDAFRKSGPNILNAAGVWNEADDLDYLNAYSFVSARSETEVERLRKWVPSATVLPCSTTLLRSDSFHIPGVEPGEPLVGIHVVPHSLRMIDDLIPIIDAIPHKKVFIPFTHYNADASFMKSLPFDRSNSITLGQLQPLELHSVIGQMSYVMVSSLHASIFAYSQNVPFASIWQQKAEDYFRDRGLTSHLARNEAELQELMSRLRDETFNFRDLVMKDAERVTAAFDNYIEILGRQVARDGGWPETVPTPTQPLDAMLLEQAQHVIGDRDLALSRSESLRLDARGELNQLSDELADTREALRRTADQLARLRGSGLLRAARTVRRFFRAVRRRVGEFLRSGNR